MRKVILGTEVYSLSLAGSEADSAGIRPVTSLQGGCWVIQSKVMPMLVDCVRKTITMLEKSYT